MGDFPAFLLGDYLAQWEFEARHVLCASDPESLSLPELLALGTDDDREAFGRLGLGYIPTWGLDELRQAIAGTYGTLGPEHILTFAGAEEAIFWVMQTCIGPGDHVILSAPDYPSLEALTIASGSEVTALSLDPDQDWALDLQALRRALRPNTRLIALSLPNNPTGALPDEDTLRGLVELCEERGIRLFVDEIHRGLELDPAARLPQVAGLSDRAISLNGTSKSYGLPGLRVGWLASRDRVLLEVLERRKHYTSICNSAPGEFLATLALRHGEAILARNLAILERNLPLFEAFFARRPDLFDWKRPMGGCVAFPRYKGEDGVEAFCRKLVEQEGVLLIPGSLFRSSLAQVPADRFRVGMGRMNPEPALEALERFLVTNGQ